MPHSISRTASQFCICIMAHPPSTHNTGTTILPAPSRYSPAHTPDPFPGCIGGSTRGSWLDLHCLIWVFKTASEFDHKRWTRYIHPGVIPFHQDDLAPIETEPEPIVKIPAFRVSIADLYCIEGFTL